MPGEDELHNRLDFARYRYTCSYIRGKKPWMNSSSASACVCHHQQCLLLVQGCLELLRRYSVPISGKRAVVLGRSNIVGMPVAHLLQVGWVAVCSCVSP